MESFSQIQQLASSPSSLSTFGVQVLAVGVSKLSDFLSSTSSRRSSKEFNAVISEASIKKGGISPDSENQHRYASALRELTLEDVSCHDSLQDCWVVIYDYVYDITTFMHEHPGGADILMEYAGRDATLAFRSVGHSKDAEEVLGKYKVGVLVMEERIWNTFESNTTGAVNNCFNATEPGHQVEIVQSG